MWKNIGQAFYISDVLCIFAPGLRNSSLSVFETNNINKKQNIL